MIAHNTQLQRTLLRRNSNPITLLQLAILKEQGFTFLATFDDGETWRGSHDYGLNIFDLLQDRKFKGTIIVRTFQSS